MAMFALVVRTSDGEYLRELARGAEPQWLEKCRESYLSPEFIESVRKWKLAEKNEAKRQSIAALALDLSMINDGYMTCAVEELAQHPVIKDCFLPPLDRIN